MCSRCRWAISWSFPESRGQDLSLQFRPVHYLCAICSLEFTPLLYQLKPFTFVAIVIVFILKQFHWMFIIHSAQFLRQTHQREVGETGHQSYQLGLQLPCLVWFYEKKAHGGRREKLLGGKRVLWNASFETPLLASWQGRKKERKKKKKNYGGFVKTQWWKRSQGRLSGWEWILPYHVEVSFHRGHISHKSVEEHRWVSAQLNREFDN